jgi:hypothetical protein
MQIITMWTIASYALVLAVLAAPMLMLATLATNLLKTHHLYRN